MSSVSTHLPPQVGRSTTVAGCPGTSHRDDGLIRLRAVRARDDLGRQEETTNAQTAGCVGAGVATSSPCEAPCLRRDAAPRQGVRTSPARRRVGPARRRGRGRPPTRCRHFWITPNRVTDLRGPSRKTARRDNDVHLFYYLSTVQLLSKSAWSTVEPPAMSPVGVGPLPASARRERGVRRAPPFRRRAMCLHINNIIAESQE